MTFQTQCAVVLISTIFCGCQGENPVGDDELSSGGSGEISFFSGLSTDDFCVESWQPAEVCSCPLTVDWSDLSSKQTVDSLHVIRFSRTAEELAGAICDDTTLSQSDISEIEVINFENGETAITFSDDYNTPRIPVADDAPALLLLSSGNVTVAGTIFVVSETGCTSELNL